MMVTTSKSAIKSVRLSMCVTPEQEMILRRAAQVTYQSLTGFILGSACQAAEETLLAQCLFGGHSTQHQTLANLLDNPE